MAATSSCISPATAVLAAVVGPARSSSFRRRTKINYITGLNSFGGLKAANCVSALGLPVCTDHSFAKFVASLKTQRGGGAGGGGALSSTCNAIDEIFKIAAIMPGLVLVGVAVGFVLLRIEGIVEEGNE